MTALQANGDRDRSDAYTARFVIDTGSRVGVFATFDPAPLPAEALSAVPDHVFLPRTINAAALGAASGAGQVAPTAVPGPATSNALVVAPTTTLALPPARVATTTPALYSLAPLLFDLPTDDYLREGLPQGAALWQGPNTSLSITDGGAPPARGDATRPKERGVRVKGTVDPSVTAVQLVLSTTAGTRVKIRPSPTATSDDHLNLDLTANAGTFDAAVFFDHAPDAFGPIFIYVIPTAPADTVLADVRPVLLVGIQIALVDDGASSPDGATAGPMLIESDEVTVVDFAGQSPQATAGALLAASRARRMARYAIGFRDRSAGRLPEMPMWMAELQLFGINGSILERLLQQRKRSLPGQPTSLAVSTSWTLQLDWVGLDQGWTPPSFQSHDSFPATAADGQVTLKFALDDNGKLVEPLSMTPARAAVSFPTSTRRAPDVVLRSRPWSRVAGGASASSMDAMVLEWQPNIVGGQPVGEMIRGGDGALSLTDVTVDGTPVVRGMSATANGSSPAPTNGPIAQLPAFRVEGKNPGTPAELEDMFHGPLASLVEQIARDVFATLGPSRLGVEAWISTLKLLMQHESKGRHFHDDRPMNMRFSGVTFGLERGMPLFGPPHGYGIAQLDTPRPSANAVWSFAENIRAAARLLMHDKAGASEGALGQVLGSDRRSRAIFRRDVVRRYNGGREFDVVGGAVHCRAHSTNLDYPNLVLAPVATAVVYPATGDFPFTDANYGSDLP